MAVNTLVKDSKESNPVVRALAIRTLCSVDHEAFVEHRLTCVTDGLKDSSAYVKRTALMACITLFRVGTDGFHECGMVNRFYEMIRDSDPIVVVNSLLALDEVLKTEGGIVLNKKIVGYLLTRMGEFTPWGLVYVTKLLQKYIPKSEDEIFDLMNILDPFLDHNSVPVSVNTLELFIGLMREMPHLREEVFQRSQNAFLSMCSSGNPEQATASIQFCNSYPEILPKILAPSYKTLFCKFKDPICLKVEKLKFVIRLINVENFKDVLEEVVVNSSDKSAEVSLVAIQSLGKLVTDLPDLSDKLLKAFKNLLHSQEEYVVSNTLQVLVTLTSQNMVIVNELGDQLCLIARQQSDNEGRHAALYLIGQIDNGSSEVLCVMEDFIEQFDDLDNKVKGQLLMTGVRMFCRRPAEFQNVLSELFELCSDSNDRDLIQQVKFYYSIFEANAQTAKQIFEVA